MTESTFHVTIGSPHTISRRFLYNTALQTYNSYCCDHVNLILFNFIDVNLPRELHTTVHCYSCT